MAWDDGREDIGRIIEQNKTCPPDKVRHEWHEWFSADGESWGNIDDEGNAVTYNPDGDDIVSADVIRDFESFLERQEMRRREAERTDWRKMREDWLRHVDEFHQIVRRFLRRYLDQGRVGIEPRPLTLNEEHLGSYETTALHLTMGSHEVVFSPVGTRMIGARGRIDMEGRAGKVRFLLVDRESGMSAPGRTDEDAPKEGKAEERRAGLIWKIATPPPSVSLIDLNLESFLDALMEVTNG